VPALCLEPVAGDRQRERTASKQAHPRLGVANPTPGGQLEEPAARPVREPPLQRHPAKIAEPVSDHELRV
jgi:hypothetical protein